MLCLWSEGLKFELCFRWQQTRCVYRFLWSWSTKSPKCRKRVLSSMIIMNQVRVKFNIFISHFMLTFYTFILLFFFWSPEFKTFKVGGLMLNLWPLTFQDGGRWGCINQTGGATCPPATSAVKTTVSAQTTQFITSALRHPAATTSCWPVYLPLCSSSSSSSKWGQAIASSSL